MAKHDINPNINLNASELPTIKCRCGNFTFASSFILKKVSALVSPSGKETIAPIQIFTCIYCGSILPIGDDNMDFIKDVRDNTMENKETSQPEAEKQPDNVLDLFDNESK